MVSENYVERVISSLSLQPREDLQARLNRLDFILEQIGRVSSPEREELLVELILQPFDSVAHDSLRAEDQAPSLGR